MRFDFPCLREKEKKNDMDLNLRARNYVQIQIEVSDLVKLRVKQMCENYIFIETRDNDEFSTAGFKTARHPIIGILL